MKATPDQLLDEIAPNLSTYLMAGSFFSLDSFTKKIDPELNINDINKLLRIHFVLTQTETEEKIGVIDFVLLLSERIRRINTTIRRQTESLNGEVKGNIRWRDTFIRRYNNNPKDYSCFVCDRGEKDYDIPENLVLKSLLQIIHNIIFNDLKVAFSKNYEWLKHWSTEKELKNTLTEIFIRNIYLKRIDLKNADVTDRMISRAAQSRLPLYKEAAMLLSRYKKLMNYDLDPLEAKELLTNTFIKPEATSVLFELYWAIRIVQQLTKSCKVTFELLEPGNNMFAKWEDDQYKYRIYHNSTGSFQFIEKIINIQDKLKNNDNYLGRQIKVLDKLAQMVGNSQDIWNGRPDIILEIYSKTDALVALFIGEVKYTDDRDYSIEGLKQLLEYMALIKQSGVYVENYDNLFDSLHKIKGCLFLDKIVYPLKGDKDIQIVAFGDQIAPAFMLNI